MTRYEDLMNQHDFYETEAREAKERRDRTKEKIFSALAREYKQKALSLPISEVMR